MEKFSILKSRAAFLIGDNINTDMIIPMDRYVLAERKDLHQFAFEPLRFLPDGSKNPDFILNKNLFVGCKILIVGHNFGCGSSREAAVWAIFGLGIRCIIGRSFGSIFFNNCFQNGILPIILEEKSIEEVMSVAALFSKDNFLSVNLIDNQITSFQNQLWNFSIEHYRRIQLMEGLDDITLTLQKTKEIEEFKKQDVIKRPWVYLRKDN